MPMFPEQNYYIIVAVILIIHVIIKSPVFSFRKSESSFLINESFHSLELTDYYRTNDKLYHYLSYYYSDMLLSEVQSFGT